MKIKRLNDFWLAMRPQTKKQHVLVHEAGHAVATCLLDYKLFSVSVDGPRGLTHRERPSDDDPEKEIPIFYAGTAAEVLVFGKAIENSRNGKELNDFENAWRAAATIKTKPGTFPQTPRFVCGEYYVPPQITADMIPDGTSMGAVCADIQALEEKGLKKAFEILSCHLPAVKRVAAALNDRKSLTGADVYALIF